MSKTLNFITVQYEQQLYNFNMECQKQSMYLVDVKQDSKVIRVKESLLILEELKSAIEKFEKAKKENHFSTLVDNYQATVKFLNLQQQKYSIRYQSLFRYQTEDKLQDIEKSFDMIEQYNLVNIIGRLIELFIEENGGIMNE